MPSFSLLAGGNTDVMSRRWPSRGPLQTAEQGEASSLPSGFSHGSCVNPSCSLTAKPDANGPRVPPLSHSGLLLRQPEEGWCVQEEAQVPNST